MAGIFKESVLTKKGIALLAKAQAGRCTTPPARFFSGISDMIHRAEKPPLFAFVPP